MRRPLITIGALSLLACAPSAADNAGDTSVRQMGSANDPATVQRAIDSSLTRFSAALIRGDTATLSSTYTEDAFVLPAGMPIARGRAAIAQMNAGMASAFSISAAKFTTTDLIVTGDYAVETGVYQMTVQPKKGKAMNDVGKYVAVWQKQPDGSWKMIRDIWNNDKQGM